MSLSKTDASNMRFVRIRDTLHLSEIEISETMLPEAAIMDRIEVIGDPYDMPFDKDGNLL